MTLHEDVFRTIAAIEATGATTEEEIVDELMTRGYDRLRAEILAVFVPMGLARAVIARLPVGHLSVCQRTRLSVTSKETDNYS